MSDSSKVWLQYLLPKQAITAFGGVVASGQWGSITTRIIQWFVGKYSVNMGEAANPDIASYASFNDFFTRALKPGARPLAQADWVEQVIAATGGRKARVVYDSVAKHTFMGSLDCTAPFGMVVLYGAASGPAPAIDPELLNKKGCLFLTRPSVFPHNADPATFRANAADVFEAMASGAVRATVGASFSLEQVANAHRAAESRATVGSILILP